MTALTLICDPHRNVYRAVLGWIFALSSSARIVAYIPTLWTIYSGGDASQHSLWTWLTFFASNLTMAAWLYEQNGQRLHKAAAISLVNAAMCGAISCLIIALRW